MHIMIYSQQERACSGAQDEKALQAKLCYTEHPGNVNNITFCILCKIISHETSSWIAIEDDSVQRNHSITLYKVVRTVICTTSYSKRYIFQTSSLLQNVFLLISIDYSDYSTVLHAVFEMLIERWKTACSTVEKLFYTYGWIAALHVHGNLICEERMLSTFVTMLTKSAWTQQPLSLSLCNDLKCFSGYISGYAHKKDFSGVTFVPHRHTI